MPISHPLFRQSLPVLALAAACLQPTLHAGNHTLPLPSTPRAEDITFSATTAAPAAYSQLIIFGDSLSDVGNDADVADDDYNIRFPGPDVFDATGTASTDYTDGRFTDGSDTDPAAVIYSGVWHEQLAKLFLGLPVAKASNDKGFDFAFGGATTGDGQNVLTEENGAVSLHVDNMGRQVSTYLDANTPDPAALFVLWGGANDLFDDEGETAAEYDATATAASNNEVALLQKLAEGGAKTFLVNNLPPLDLTPDYSTDATNGPLIKEATTNFNTQLAQKLAGVQNTLAAEGLTVTIYQMDVYGLFTRLLANQDAYGFTNITQSSQTAGSGIDPDKYLFWDGVHPTTAGHFQLACEAYSVLTGIPVVEVNPASDNSGFYLTRTGPDTSAKLSVNYALGGTDTAATITSFKGVKKIKPGKQTVELTTTPVDATQTVETLKIKGGTGYALPVVKKAKIKLTD